MGGKAGPRPEGRHQEAEPGPHEGVGGGGAVRRVPQAPEVSRAIGEGACLTQNLRGGTLQGLLPNLLDGVEVHLGRLGQSCVEKGRRPAAAPPLCAPHPHSGGLSFGQESVGGSGEGVEEGGGAWAVCVCVCVSVCVCVWRGSVGQRSGGGSSPWEAGPCGWGAGIYVGQKAGVGRGVGRRRCRGSKWGWHGLRSLVRGLSSPKKQGEVWWRSALGVSPACPSAPELTTLC